MVLIGRLCIGTTETETWVTYNKGWYLSDVLIDAGREKVGHYLYLMLHDDFLICRVNEFRLQAMN